MVSSRGLRLPVPLRQSLPLSLPMSRLEIWTQKQVWLSLIHILPEGMWVVFENDGVFKEDVQSVFRRFLTEFLPFSGYEYAGLPAVSYTHLDVYKRQP